MRAQASHHQVRNLILIEVDHIHDVWTTLHINRMGPFGYTSRIIGQDHHFGELSLSYGQIRKAILVKITCNHTGSTMNFLNLLAIMKVSFTFSIIQTQAARPSIGRDQIKVAILVQIGCSDPGRSLPHRIVMIGKDSSFSITKENG